MQFLSSLDVFRFAVFMFWFNQLAAAGRAKMKVHDSDTAKTGDLIAYIKFRDPMRAVMSDPAKIQVLSSLLPATAGDDDSMSFVQKVMDAASAISNDIEETLVDWGKYQAVTSKHEQTQ